MNRNVSVEVDKPDVAGNEINDEPTDRLEELAGDREETFGWRILADAC